MKRGSPTSMLSLLPGLFAEDASGSVVQALQPGLVLLSSPASANISVVTSTSQSPYYVPPTSSQIRYMVFTHISGLQWMLFLLPGMTPCIHTCLKWFCTWIQVKWNNLSIPKLPARVNDCPSFFLVSFGDLPHSTCPTLLENVNVSVTCSQVWGSLYWK